VVRPAGFPFRLAKLIVTLSLSPLPARATYSVIGVDTTANELGGSGTSCLRGSDVYIIYGSVPGVGVVHAQAQYNGNARDRALLRFREGLSPAEIMMEITSDDYDASASVRQYAIADIAGNVVGFTGSDTQPYADDVQGTVQNFVYSVQGNILTSEAVLSQAAAGFEATGCDLAERLMRALEAGAENGEGDSRCTDSLGIPSDSAFIQVDRARADDEPYLELHVPRSGEDNPLIDLRAQFDEWRTTHPCSSAGGAAGGSGGAGGGGSGGVGGVAGASAAGGVGGAAGGAASGLGGAGGSGAAGAGASGEGGTSGGGGLADSGSGPNAQEEAGCGCRVPVGRGTGRSGALWGGLFALALLGARRWNRRGHRC
jgi:uncharacterized Ntn-hydrolase superfamily protein